MTHCGPYTVGRAKCPGQAMVESLGTLLGMGAGAAETELALREEQFKVRVLWVNSTSRVIKHDQKMFKESVMIIL